jgi:putative transposase
MARLARVVAAGIAHHVTQRGNRRQTVFFGDDDYRAYEALLAEGCASAGVAVWGCCLMPNPVHLILVPRDEAGLREALSEAHRRYTRRVNLREGWRGHLWQGRFASVPMDEAHLLACARYVELNRSAREADDYGAGVAVVERAGSPPLSPGAGSGRPRRWPGSGRAAVGAGR